MKVKLGRGNLTWIGNTSLVEQFPSVAHDKDCILADCYDGSDGVIT